MNRRDWILAILFCITFNSDARSVEILDLGSRRESFVDHFLIERLDGVQLELGHPQPAAISVHIDRPWEGTVCGDTTVFQDGDRVRMYFRGRSTTPGFRYTICCAESSDGIHWTKPDVGMIEVQGTKVNNVVKLENQVLVPFLDTRPGISAEQKFKGNVFVEPRFGAKRVGLQGFVSSDGLNWTAVREEPIVLEQFKNNFDSHNVMFWSEIERYYVLYARQSESGIRAHSRATSKDFVNWTPQVLMTYSDTGTTVPSDQLYTNAVQPYFRAPHIYVSMPGRLMPGRRALSAEQEKKLDADPHTGGAGDCSDGVLQTTRAGKTRFDRTFREAFIRPGVGGGNWVSRANYPACGIVQTSPTELSFYVQRQYGLKSSYVERMKLRLDGFASVHAPFVAGEMLTRPFQFTGRSLEINCSTSAAGGIRVELQDADGKAIHGFSLADCDEIITDEIARIVTWKSVSDVGTLVGKSVRLRFQLHDADLYALQFK